MRQTEKKVNAIVDEILDEDQENDFGVTQTETCPGGCEELNDTPKEEARDSGEFPSLQTPGRCKCGVENSSRFSLRVMEAMRSLQRDVDQPSTSTAEEIADYIRSHYRHDGDLYAQVRTALRQVCSQGYVMELLSNEYHLIGPVAIRTKRNGCSWDCRYRATDDSRRHECVDDARDATIDRLGDLGPSLHSTRISANERDTADRRGRELNADVSGVRGDRRRRDAIGTEQRDAYEEPIPGPSRGFTRTPSPAGAGRNTKKARVEGRRAHRADEGDDETATEEDVDCTCDAEAVAPDEHLRIRSPGRAVVRNQRDGRRRNDVEEDEEDEEKKMKDDEEDEEDEGERAREEDEDAEEDSAYEELRARVPRGRAAAREHELRRWIRRCREECERRRGR
ncbi:PREDICTED: RNA-binding protein 25-like [Vollenhovia emeryi]|uniref:RNA-binding protein 25-like n=1 Tax=Vollenhovia emeryi TaxID=411798 RepID=UPI0005F4FDB3|nr:PREDICTED: RNA-binding protein 25-like [Vollenhovia emeryi]